MSTILGVVVYRADRAGQNRCLVECLAPTLEALADTDGSVDLENPPARYWIDRYDLRGPHLLALLGIAEDRLAMAGAQLEKRLAEWLDAHPATDSPPNAELEQRHLGCRGRAMCRADELPGMAPNDSFQVFEHPPAGFPFVLGRELEQHDELWRHLSAIPFWLVRQIAATGDHEPVSAALAWVAATDRALSTLAETGETDAALRYWRHHASTLVPGAPVEKLEPRLPELIGERNLLAFDKAWQQLAVRADPIPGLPRAVELLTSGGPPFPALRELDHSLLRALGLPTVLQAPIIFYAWYRHQRAEVAS